MEASQLQALANGISTLVEGIRADDREARRGQVRENRIKEQIKAISTCDGEVAEDVREWIESIEISLPLLKNIPSGAMKLVTRTISGALRKEVEGLLDTQHDRLTTQWTVVREHVRNSFLSANESDKFKVDVEKFRQAPQDNIYVFNRKFRDMANTAYPQPRADDAERILIIAYVKALRNEGIAKKLSTEERPGTLEEAI